MSARQLLTNSYPDVFLNTFVLDQLCAQGSKNDPSPSSSSPENSPNTNQPISKSIIDAIYKATKEAKKDLVVIFSQPSDLSIHAMVLPLIARIFAVSIPGILCIVEIPISYDVEKDAEKDIEKLLINGFETLTLAIPENIDRTASAPNPPSLTKSKAQPIEQVGLRKIKWAQLAVMKPPDPDDGVCLVFSNGVECSVQSGLVTYENGSMCQITLDSALNALENLGVPQHLPVLLFIFTHPDAHTHEAILSKARNRNTFIIEICVSSSDLTEDMHATASSPPQALPNNREQMDTREDQVQNPPSPDKRMRHNNEIQCLKPEEIKKDQKMLSYQGGGEVEKPRYYDTHSTFQPYHGTTSSGLPYPRQYERGPLINHSYAQTGNLNVVHPSQGPVFVNSALNSWVHPDRNLLHPPAIPVASGPNGSRPSYLYHESEVPILTTHFFDRQPPQNQYQVWTYSYPDYYHIRNPPPQARPPPTRSPSPPPGNVGANLYEPPQ